MLYVLHIYNVLEKCVSPGTLADVYNHHTNSLFRDWILLMENTTSCFLSFHGWHLITENHIIWLAGMCRW